MNLFTKLFPHTHSIPVVSSFSDIPSGQVRKVKISGFENTRMSYLTARSTAPWFNGLFSKYVPVDQENGTKVWIDRSDFQKSFQITNAEYRIAESVCKIIKTIRGPETIPSTMAGLEIPLLAATRLKSFVNKGEKVDIPYKISFPYKIWNPVSHLKIKMIKDSKKRNIVIIKNDGTKEGGFKRFCIAIPMTPNPKPLAALSSRINHDIDEMALLEKCKSSKHILPFEDKILYNTSSKTKKCYFLMKLCSKGTLEVASIKTKKSRDTALQCAQAVADTHECNVIHRDIKEDNFLLDERGQIFLADFGLACEKSASAQEKLRACGTIPNLAPEIIAISLNRENHAPIDEKSDIWALGLMFYRLWTDTRLSCQPDTASLRACQKHPGLYLAMEHFSDPMIKKEIDSHKRLSDNARQLLHEMLRSNPSDRCTAKRVVEVLKNPAFSIYTLPG